jgi:TetR/AcrR family transcriptional regulator, transcriptional repressor for nem operon
MAIRAARSVPRPARGEARGALLEAALRLVRRKGWHDTSIDELCAEAGVTKGAFFHHFAGKDALGIAAARHWSETTGALFAEAPYHTLADPLDRVLAYIDFRSAIIAGDPAEFTCLAGTMVQEAWATSEPIRAACADSIFGHAATLEADIAAALAQHGIAGISARSLAWHTQAVLQGGFILAKAAASPEPARDSAAHLRRYFELLFQKDRAA